MVFAPKNGKGVKNVHFKVQKRAKGVEINIFFNWYTKLINNVRWRK